MRFILLLSLFLFSVINIKAQQIVERDPEISKMLQQVSADSLKKYINEMVAFGTRNTLSDQKSKTRGIGAARNYVLKKFEQFATSSGGNLSAFIDTVTLQPDGRRVDKPTVLGNVVATLKGNDANDKRIIVISAHLDNMRSSVMDRTGDAPGANDDASGVAAVIECARVLSRYQFGPTIKFVAFSGEEQGLLGANYMAKKAKTNNQELIAILNNDIIGSINSNGTNNINNNKLRVFSEGLPAFELDSNSKRIRQLGLENDGASRQLARYFKETGERYVDNLQIVMIYRNDRFLRGGDHTPFVENGYAGIRMTEFNENYTRQHQDVRLENGIQYGDLPEFIDAEYLKRNTSANLATLANMAKAPSEPQQVSIDVSRLSNSSLLRWGTPKSGRPKGYYVLLRETTSAVWEKKFFTTQLQIELPYSKDNYFYSVQSVSDAGNESLPVIPIPKR